MRAKTGSMPGAQVEAQRAAWHAFTPKYKARHTCFKHAFGHSLPRPVHTERLYQDFEGWVHERNTPTPLYWKLGLGISSPWWACADRDSRDHKLISTRRDIHNRRDTIWRFMSVRPRDPDFHRVPSATREEGPWWKGKSNQLRSGQQGAAFEECSGLDWASW